MTSSSFRVLQWLRWRLFRNGLEELVQQSPARLVIILFFSVLICGGMLGISFAGFSWLRHDNVFFAGSIIGILFDFMFVALAVLLLYSTGLILYSSLFASAESAFLLTTPAVIDQVFAYKFQGAVAFSSWAFLLLGGPVLVAYGITFDVSWHFYVLLPLFFVGFLLLPGSLGALACLLIVNLVPQRRKEVLVLALVVILAAAGAWAWQVIYSLRTEVWTSDLMQELFGRLWFVGNPLVPTNWMTRGLQAAARGAPAEAGYRLALVWSNGLFFYLITAWMAQSLPGRPDLYRRGYNRLATGGELRRRYGGHWLDRALDRLVGFLDPQTRLLIIKDFRTFRRDPAQWAQIAIFTGLLTLYFAITRRFYQEDISRPYQNGISLLNLVSVALLLCAYTSRFIYPLFSLEGRKFWVLGLLPLKRERLLWGKFAFSLSGSFLIAEFLVIFSDVAMGMPAEAIGLHAVTVAVLALGLSGLCVGLGAAMPNFRESDPSKIAIGFGGTLNLIAGLLFVLLAVALMALPWHVSRALAPESDLPALEGWLLAAAVGGVVLGILTAVMPLRLGCRALRQMEF